MHHRPYSTARFHAQPMPPRRTNGLGVAGFIVSLLSLVFTCGVLSPVGLLLSIGGLMKRPRGFAVAGTILGMLGSTWLAMMAAGACMSSTEARHHHARVQHVQKRTITEDAILTGIKQIEDYRSEHGELPEGVQGNKLVLDVQDGWGNSVRYELQRDKYLIRSAGRDGKFGNRDDVTTPGKTYETSTEEAGESSPGVIDLH